MFLKDSFNLEADFFSNFIKQNEDFSLIKQFQSSFLKDKDAQKFYDINEITDFGSLIQESYSKAKNEADNHSPIYFEENQFFIRLYEELQCKQV